MSEPLDELYFVWLYSQVGDPEVRSSSRKYWKILRQLFTKEFVWIVPNDDNRIEDGKDLRTEFVDQSELKNVDPHWMKLGCSMLELMVGLSRRLAFTCEGEPRDWFWHLAGNIGIDNYNDGARYSQERVDDILDRVIWRTYAPDGTGGLFPLRESKEDQRFVEIWYQLSAYILEFN